MKIIPNNLKRMYDLYAPEYEQKALEVLRSGWYILGREVEHFEKNLPLIWARSTAWDWPTDWTRCG